MEQTRNISTFFLLDLKIYCFFTSNKQLMQLIANIQIGEALSIEDIKTIERYAEAHRLSFDVAAVSFLRRGIEEFAREKKEKTAKERKRP